jgi:hypothetical protein
MSPFCSVRSLGIASASGKQRFARACSTLNRTLFPALAAPALIVFPINAHAGTWTTIKNAPPINLTNGVLLTDGTVMAADGGSGWYKLTPDAHGSYVNGTWSTLASSIDTRLYYSSQVLPNGNVYVCGGEYGTGANKSELYNPLTNTWTAGPNSQLSGTGYIDSISQLLPDGTVLQGSTGTNCQIYNPVTNSYGTAFNSIRGMDEMDWCKLPDDSILSIDDWGTNSERYIPSQAAWVADANTPVALCDSQGEIGSSNLLPNGKVFAIGATPNTAIYTPSGSASPGTWVLGPAVPSGLGADDAPAAAETSGTVLFTLGPSGTYNGPTSFFEYNYTANTVTQINGPTGSTDNVPPFTVWMLDLPDGTVLYKGSNNTCYFYTPSGSPLAAGKPAIGTVIQNSDGSYHLTGTGLNGISQGAKYGDDKQMDSNFPIVRLTNKSTGNVYYARTYNWSSTGVMTGSKILSTDFALPSGIPNGTYSLVTVANGNPSAAVTFTLPFPGPIFNGAHTLTPACALGSGLDDPGYQIGNGTKLDIWQSLGGANQNWNFSNVGGHTYAINVSLGQYCLDDMGGAQGTQAAIWSCNGGTNQKWTVNSASSGFTFQNTGGLCLDVNGGGSANGTAVQNWPCNGGTNQTWIPDYVAPSISNGIHTLTPLCATGSGLDDPAYSTANGTGVDIWQSLGGANQNWNFSKVSGSNYNINVSLGQYCLDDIGGAQGTQAAIWSCNGGANQMWTATPVTGGWMFQNSGSLCLDVNGGGSANGTAIQSWPCNGSNAQTWIVNAN